MSSRYGSAPPGGRWVLGHTQDWKTVGVVLVEDEVGEMGMTW